MSAPAKIAVYSVSDLKNTTDDALPNYLSSLQFKQSHKLTDVRLLLGYTAVLISGALFYFDWKQGWDVTKPYTLPAVVAYFILNGAFTWWIWRVERGVVFMGDVGGRKIRISSRTEKHKPIYFLTVDYDSEKGKPQEIQIQASFTRWFTSEGYFVAKPFQQWLASEVPLIGEQDPSNVVEEIGRGNVNEEKGMASGVGDGRSPPTRKRKV
ncbi:SPC25-domain-containing protein [Patellaria atrata CBS 101060]|uniref:Signal peptidase complex subunit 2 n=1 Tax=Patellaria atrata CBS 101060 TaxID=1346257 RepID=A0A9P4VKJ1_9PEZI|nr:SPC25-domain-containing protein [Patellaria atrata CBS 101060]